MRGYLDSKQSMPDWINPLDKGCEHNPARHFEIKVHPECGR
jgi:hypothetical protein